MLDYFTAFIRVLRAASCYRAWGLRNVCVYFGFDYLMTAKGNFLWPRFPAVDRHRFENKSGIVLFAEVGSDKVVRCFRFHV